MQSIGFWWGRHVLISKWLDLPVDCQVVSKIQLAISEADIIHGYRRWSILSSLVGGLNPSEKYEFVNWDD